MKIIPPDWFAEPVEKWESLPKNERIALRWVAAGAKVFPCYSRVEVDERGIHRYKAPKSAHGFKDATDSFEVVRKWWSENPDDLVGVACEERLTIIDIDMDADRDEPVDGWASLIGSNISLPEDFMPKTPRGGNHVYCRTPDGVAPNSVKNITLPNGTVLDGVDRRARGGYFIGWSEELIPRRIEELPAAPLILCHQQSGQTQSIGFSGSLADWLNSLGQGEPDEKMWAVIQEIPRGEFGHDKMRTLQRRIVGLVAEGHPGGEKALEILLREYTRAPYDTPRWHGDFAAALEGAVQKFGGSAGEADNPPKRNLSAAAVDLAVSNYDFFPTLDDDILAVPKNGPKVSMSVAGKKSFYPKLALKFYEASGGTKALSDTAYGEAVGIITGSVLSKPRVEAHFRVGDFEGATYVDLGDETGRCVRITNEGWSVEQESPILFRRNALISPLPEPERSGDLRPFLELVNIPAERELLYLGFLVSFYFPQIAHPILVPIGGQGSGKSKASEYTVRLLDNSPVTGRKLPRSIEEWVVAAQASYLISLDNVSKLSPEMSDALCRAVTDDGDVRRALYENKGVELFSFRRILILNGIDILGIREDLADRLLTMEMRPIPPERRLSEAAMDDAFEQHSPSAFGALLDLVVKVKNVLGDVEVKDAPRMADFARILVALENVTGGSALGEYRQGLEESAMSSIVGDPVLTAIVELIDSPWEGTSAELLELLNTKKPQFQYGERFWPSKPVMLTSTLVRCAPAFQKIGWVFEDLGARNQAKTKRFRIEPPTKPKADSEGVIEEVFFNLQTV